MGLDNGIVLRYRNVEKLEQLIPNYVRIDKDFDDDHEVFWDVCYWRKCWGLRAKILRVLSHHASDDEEKYEWDLTIDDLIGIRDIIIGYLVDPDKWDDEDMSIWMFRDMVAQFAQEIVNLTWLIEFMRRDHKASAYFYDSY